MSESGRRNPLFSSEKGVSDNSFESLSDGAEPIRSHPGEASEDVRSLWRQSKAFERHPSLRKISEMEEVGKIKRTISKSLNVLVEKAKLMQERAEDFRKNKSFTRNSDEYEMLLNDLDDLKASEERVNARFAEGDAKCATLDPKEEVVKRWSEYTEEKEELRDFITEVLDLLHSAVRRADLRTESKLREEALSARLSKKYGDDLNSSLRETLQLPRNDHQLSFSSPVVGRDHEGDTTPPPALTANIRDNVSSVRNETRIWGTNSVRTGNNANTAVVPSIRPQLSLPKHFFEIEIPIFDGNPANWDNFWNSFNKYVHCQEFDDSIKLSILSKHCSGKARKYVDLAKRNGIFYGKAIDSMLEQFNSPYMKRGSLLKAFEDLAPAKENADSMEATLYEVINLLEGLQTCDEINTAHLRREVKAKFPIEVALKMEKREQQFAQDWSMNDLLENLAVTVKNKRAEENARQNMKAKNDLSSSPVAKYSKFQGTNRNFQANSSSSDQKLKCGFCGYNNHTAGECRKITDLGDISRLIRKNRLCHVCLTPGHRASDCSGQSCTKCNKRHHTRTCQIFCSTQNVVESSNNRAFVPGTQNNDSGIQRQNQPSSANNQGPTNPPGNYGNYRSQFRPHGQNSFRSQ